MTAELEPVAWVVPGNDNASDYGFFDAMAWQEGEFSLPLVTLSSAQEAIDKREERIRELEATIKQMKADHACEVTDMATRFRAVNVERLSEQLGADVFALRDRAEAAEARVKELEAALVEGRATVWLNWYTRAGELVDKLAAAEARASALQALLDEVVTAWEALPGGEQSVRAVERWLASDMKPVIDKLRAARSLAAKIKEAKG